MSSERSPGFQRRDVLALSSLAIGSSVAGCTAARRDVRAFRLGTAERQIAPDWHPAPGQWPMPEYNLARTNHNPFATPPRSEPETAWTFDDYRGGLNALVVAAETVFVRTQSELVAVDAADGTERWRRSRSAPGHLTYIAGRLYDSGRDTLHALAPDGTEHWSTAVDIAYYSIVERDGWVFVCSRNGVQRLHADTGDVLAESDTEAYRPSTTGTTIYAGRFNIDAYRIHDDEFVSHWTAAPEGAYEAYTAIACAAGHLYRGERTLGGSTQPTGRLSIADATEGSIRATVSFDNTPRSPAVAGGSVYVSTSSVTAGSLGDHGRCVALSHDGDERWTYEPGASLQPPVVANEAVYLGPFANTESPLIAFDAATGDELWHTDVDGSPTLAAAGDALYVSTDDEIRALRATSGRERQA